MVSESTSPLMSSSEVATAQAPVRVPASLTVNEEPLSAVFRALSSHLQQAVSVSPKAGRYKVSGRFDLAKPMAMIEQLSRDLGLLWYFDGRVVYVYDSSEARTTMFPLPAGMLSELRAFLQAAALYDPKYPFGTSGDERSVYLYGPPKYIEIVQAAVQMLRAKAMETRATTGQRDVDGRGLALIRLKYASVVDRDMDVRGKSRGTPGVATVLQQVLAGSIHNATAQPRAGRHVPLPALPLGGEGGVGGIGGLDGIGGNVDAVVGAAANASAAASARAGASGRGKFAEIPSLPGLWQANPLPSSMSDSMSNSMRPSFTQDVANAPARVIAYPDTNSLLIDGTPSQIESIKQIIALLDAPKKQIELSLWVIDIRKGDSQELGASFSGNLAISGILGLEMNLGTSAATISNAQANRLLAKVTALSSEQRAHIVSRPILLTQDNVAAVFDNSHTFYVEVKGHRMNSLESFSYGTMINVLPRVTSDEGRIEMRLDIEDGKRSAPLSADKGIALPVILRTQISTVARVMHDQSLLVGGYTLEDNGSGINKIPLLGDIPYLGALFRYKTGRADSYIRMFLIQPKVLGEDAVFEGEDAVRSDPRIDNVVDALRERLEGRYAR